MPFLNTYPQLKTIQEIARFKKVSVYLVGGFIRDHLLGRMTTDFDFAVSRNALVFARIFARKIRGAFVLLDQERGCARIVKKDQDKTYTFDFADFRAKTFKGDLAHRDFTINTLALDVLALTDKAEMEDVLLDDRQGMKDLRAKRVRMVSAEVFEEDPLRMMRAYSLQAVLGFKIERKTLTQIKKNKDLIRGVSYERIREELFKVLESIRASEGIYAMDKMGLLDIIIPQIRVMHACPQGTYHHLDVWPHSLEALNQLEQLLTENERTAAFFKQHQFDEDLKRYLNETLGSHHSRFSLIKLAALLHDIGKPDTRRKEPGGRVSFHGHERVGKNIVRIIAKLLKLSTPERHGLEDMVLWHLRPGYLSNFVQPSKKAVYRYFRDAKKEAASILLLSLADQRATRGPLTTPKDQQHHEQICLNLLRQYFEKQREKPFVRLISGDDLIKEFKLKPSPLFGKILSAVEEKQNLGQIKTKEEALGLAAKLIERG